MRREIKIGLLAIVTAALAIWGYNFIRGQKLLSGDRTYFTTINNAKSINTATKVLINGYQVGSVISIDPDPADIRRINIGFQVKKEIQLPNYTVVEVRNEGPIGGKELVLVFDKYCDESNCAENKSFLDSKMIGLVGSIISPEELDPHIASVTASLESTIGRLGREDSDAALDKTIRNLSVTMENMASSTSKFANLMSRSSNDIEKTMANMAILTDALVSSNAKLSGILNDFAKLTKDLSQVSVSETVSKSNMTIDQAGKSLKALETTMTDANLMVKDLNKLVKNMHEGEGSIGQLLNDKELYTQLSSTTKNMNLLLQDIRLNPRRYFKVFGRKVPDYEFPSDDPAEGK